MKIIYCRPPQKWKYLTGWEYVQENLICFSNISKTIINMIQFSPFSNAQVDPNLFDQGQQSPAPTFSISNVHTACQS